MGALTDEERDALARDYAAEVRHYTDDDGVTFPQETWIVMALRR